MVHSKKLSYELKYWKEVKRVYEFWELKYLFCIMCTEKNLRFQLRWQKNKRGSKKYVTTKQMF